MRDKTEKVLGQIEELVRDMTYSADEMYGRHADARYEYERVSVEDDFLTGTDDDGEFLERDMDEAIEVMEEYSNDFRIELDTFDKQLMKLIKLRGKLAEEIGVPIGGKQWVRYETFTM
jgi:hypothetical protein